jgi:drug/metabolite transporter superfamily protein YnfA
MNFSFFLVVWIFCAIACPFLAWLKNRDALEWLILGAFYGVVSVVLVVVLPKRTDDNEQGRLAAPVVLATVCLFTLSVLISDVVSR